MLEIVSRPGFTRQGESVVTSNAEEMRPESARLGPIWQRFYARRAGKPRGVPLAIYDRYASDHRGRYRVTVADDHPEPGQDPITVHDGTYAHFVADGPQPATLVETWSRIWTLTEEGHLLRAFTADYEEHVSANRVEIYVALRQLAQTP